MTNNSDTCLHAGRAARAGGARLGRGLRQARSPRDFPIGSRRSWRPSSPSSTPHFSPPSSAAGAPYIQHRGGPKGFIKVLDEHTLGFADYAGNRQYITLGNLAENDRAYLFLLDFAGRQRIKVWGRARVVEDDPALLARLADSGYRGEAGARDPVHGRGLGRELLAAHHRALQRSRGAPTPRSVLRDRIAELEAENAAALRAALVYAGALRTLFARAVRCASYLASQEPASHMNHDNYDDSYIRGILNTVKTIAMVGVSTRRTGRAISRSSICWSAATA